MSTSLLKCLGKDEVPYVLLELHEGIVGKYLGAREFSKKILREGYFLPTMVRDT